ncbi:endonuclease [Maribacter sp. Asnod1-A12]|uniref:endonuclease n=1 Tax=Maribacter sp. Asnod1-A12 TaxID=3160576 RepID=UPI00386F8B7A
MKYLYIFLGILVMSSCSSDSDVDVIELPVAENDVAVTSINIAISLNVLDNDELNNQAAIVEFDNISQNGGTIIETQNSTFFYTPASDFTGTDSFTYTICDALTVPNCSTAIVTVTVEGNGDSIANDDIFNVVEDGETYILDVLENDLLLDEVEIISIDDSSLQGTLELSDEGIISYTALPDFEGEENFSYTFCFNGGQTDCSTGMVTVTVVQPISFSIPSELQDYYNEVVFTNSSDILFDELESHTKAMHTTILSYGQRHNFLYNADADLDNQDNVILMYSGESRYWEEYTSDSNPYSPQTFNTEHIYPQSLLSSEDAVSDLHHLRVADAEVNSERLNYRFAEGSGSYTLVNNNSWYPGDDWRGDVARMVLYLNVRYGEPFSRVGDIDLFLEWNIVDPVSSFEEQRNNVIYAAQGNRNPFIDNPYFATLIWGGNDAENKWE